jgi:hypothetical protein
MMLIKIKEFLNVKSRIYQTAAVCFYLGNRVRVFFRNADIYVYMPIYKATNTGGGLFLSIHPSKSVCMYVCMFRYIYLSVNGIVSFPSST